MENSVNIMEAIGDRLPYSLKELQPYKAPKLDWEDLDKLVADIVPDMLSKSGSKVAVLYDCDVDGTYSGYILDDFLQRMNFNVIRHMNQEKRHGIATETIDWLKDEKPDYLFVVDAGSGDVPQLNELSKHMRVTVLDHHPYDRTLKLSEAVIRLNISDRDDLPNLSGCGVTYRFVEAFGKMVGQFTGQYEKFVGITVLSDICDLTDQENRYYVERAYEEYDSTAFFRQFKYYGSKKSFYQFSVIPYLNRLCRIGSTERVISVAQNMNSGSRMARIAQDVQRVKGLERGLIDEVRELSRVFDTPSCVIALRTKDHLDDVTADDIAQNPSLGLHTGLRAVNGVTANILINEYHKSALVLYYDRDTRLCTGSFRGWNFDNSVLKKWNMKAMGHANACGIEVSIEDLHNFVANFKLENDHKPAEYLMEVTLDEMKPKDWVRLAQYNELAGDGTGLSPVRLKLNVKETDADEVLSNRNNTKNTLHFGDNVITEFTNNDYDPDMLIVEPTANGHGYQLIRQ